MAAIYDIEIGTIVSENSGITTLKKHEQLPEYGVELRPVQTTTAPVSSGPCDEYMSIIKELLKDL